MVEVFMGFNSLFAKRKISETIKIYFNDRIVGLNLRHMLWRKKKLGKKRNMCGKSVTEL